jgi:hypothetical protein
MDDAEHRAAQKAKGRVELMAMWSRNGYPPSGRLRDQDITVWEDFLAELKAIPEGERGFIGLQDNKFAQGKAPTHRLLYQAPKPKAAPATRGNNEPDW